MIKLRREGLYVGARGYFKVLQGWGRQRELTLYEILEVKTGAGSDEIKKSYYRVAKKWHPDLHQGDEEVAERFKRIQKAYEVLGNPISREAYDIEKGLNVSNTPHNIYSSARFSKQRMSYRLKRQNEPYFNKYTGWKKPKWYSPFNGRDTRAQYRAFSNALRFFGNGPPRIMKMMEWVLGNRVWFYLGVFGLLQLYLSVKWRLSDSQEEKLKLEIFGQGDQSRLKVEGDEVQMEDEKTRALLFRYIEERRAAIASGAGST